MRDVAHLYLQHMYCVRSLDVFCTRKHRLACKHTCTDRRSVHAHCLRWCACLLQDQHGILVTHVDGKMYDALFGASSDEWRKRRRLLSPAFSAHKMKLVCFFHNYKLLMLYVWFYILCKTEISVCWHFVTIHPILSRWNHLLRRAHHVLLKRFRPWQRMGKQWTHFRKWFSVSSKYVHMQCMLYRCVTVCRITVRMA